MSTIILDSSVENALEYIHLYKNVFNAKVIEHQKILHDRTGLHKDTRKVGHAIFKIGDSILYFVTLLIKKDL